MKIIDLRQTSPLWHEFRKGKVTGTRLGEIWAARQYTKDDLVKLLESKKVEFKKSSKKDELESLLTDEDKAVLASQAEKKLEFYQLIADYLAVDRDDENRMDRGTRLEDEAAQAFVKKYHKKLEVVGCCASDVEPRIINSPDRLVAPKKAGEYTEAVEIKCLKSALHLQAAIEDKIPDEYFTQKIQYFVVNEKLQKLYWVFYDPAIPSLPLHVIVVTREELGDWPNIMLRFQLAQLKEMDAVLERLAF